MTTEFSDLPSEVVRHILTFVPSRHQAALVCKEFYEHVCSIEKDNYILKLNLDVHINDANQEYINLLLASKRQISEIFLFAAAGTVTNNLDAIFNKFGGKVKKFRVESSVKEQQLLRWLNKMPLLEEISFRQMAIEKESKRPIPPLNLPKLKKVTFKESLVGRRMNILNAFPAGAIQELSWNNCFQQDKATSFLRNQLNIKLLELGDDSLADESLLNQLNLKELSIHNEFDVPYKMLCQQRNLTSLTLKNIQLDNDLFSTICDMNQLEYLDFPVESLPAASLANLERLTNLKSLLMCDGDKDQLEAITQLNMQNLEYLGLWSFPENDLDVCWGDIEGRMGSVKKVRFGPCISLSVFESLIEEFPKLESIKMSITGNQLQWADDMEYDPYPNVFDYSVLKQFYIVVHFMNPIRFNVLPLVNICENLEEISLHTPLDFEVLAHVLSSKSKLRKLAINIDEESSMSPEINLNIVDALDGKALQLRALFITFETNTWNMSLDLEFIKKRLIDRFPIIADDASSLTIKKRGEDAMGWK